jgi:hypothetical protein
MEFRAIPRFLQSIVIFHTYNIFEMNFDFWSYFYIVLCKYVRFKNSTYAVHRQSLIDPSGGDPIHRLAIIFILKK